MITIWSKHKEVNKMKITEKEERTILAVFGELQKMPYSKLNTFLGSITIEEMNDLYRRLRKEYHDDEQEEW
jgi:hypothetical protein